MVVSCDRGKERGGIIRRKKEGGVEWSGRGQTTGRLLITRASNQMYVNIIKQCNGCFAHEIFITFDARHLWQTACN